jgi:hypothetical protein
MLGAGDCMECYGYNIELMLPLAIVWCREGVGARIIIICELVNVAWQFYYCIVYKTVRIQFLLLVHQWEWLCRQEYGVCRYSHEYVWLAQNCSLNVTNMIMVLYFVLCTKPLISSIVERNLQNNRCMDIEILSVCVYQFYVSRIKKCVLWSDHHTFIVWMRVNKLCGGVSVICILRGSTGQYSTEVKSYWMVS